MESKVLKVRGEVNRLFRLNVEAQPDMADAMFSFDLWRSKAVSAYKFDEAASIGCASFRFANI